MSDTADRGLAFVIDGREYPAPDMDSLTMLERRVMYDLCGIVQEDFAVLEDEDADTHDARVSKLIRHPGFMEALMTIGYSRGNPDQKPDAVRKVIEGTNYLDSIAEWSEAQEDAPTDPLALTPDGQSSSEKQQKNGSSGDDSTRSSDEPAGDPRGTGTPLSDTPSTARRVTLHT